MSAFLFLEPIMTIVVQRPSQSYAARPNRPYTLSATVPAGLTINRLKITLTRESWPAGPLCKVTLTWPDGSTAFFTCNGGDELDRNGQPRLTSGQEWTGPFPDGDYTLDFTLYQTATSALTIERF